MRESLWIRVICTKYSVKGFGQYLSNPNGPYGLSLWLFIWRGFRTYPHFSLEVGDGSTKFFF